MNAILIDKQVINCDRITSVDIACLWPSGKEGRCTEIYSGKHCVCRIDDDSETSKAVSWWFIAADRKSYQHLQSTTIDIVALYRKEHGCLDSDRPSIVCNLA